MTAISLIFFILCIFWIISEIALAYLKRSSRQTASERDKASLRILWVTIILSISAGAYLGVSGIGRIWNGTKTFLGIGIVLIAAGLLLRWWAIFTLRKYFTVNVAIVEGHKIIQKGLYKKIRHPSYSGSLISFLGLGITFASWVSILIIFIPICIAFLHRIHIEERALLAEFGDDYRNYMNHTARLIPKLH